MVVGWALHAIRHGSLDCRLEHCDPLRLPADEEEFEERQKRRKEILGVWMNSVSDDLDVISDWWFFLRMYELHGIDIAGGFYPRATLALLVACVMGTVSYVLELYQTVFKYPATFKWLAPFTILFEDVPQVVLSLLLSGKLAASKNDGLLAFNIATSVYSALMKLSGEVFVNYCYCCKFTPAEDGEDRRLVGYGSV